MVDEIAGYTYGGQNTARSPVSLEELDRLKATVMFTEEDERALAMAGDVLQDQVGEILAAWYDFVGSQEHLVAAFATPAGEPIQEYLDRVRARFEQWILDVCRRRYDQTWLDYQEEIGLRHTKEKKNVTDAVESTGLVPLRYLIAFIYPVTATIRPYLAAKGHSKDEVEAMYGAWCKAVTLHVTLWTRPYVATEVWRSCVALYFAAAFGPDPAREWSLGAMCGRHR